MKNEKTLRVSAAGATREGYAPELCKSRILKAVAARFHCVGNRSHSGWKAVAPIGSSLRTRDRSSARSLTRAVPWRPIQSTLHHMADRRPAPVHTSRILALALSALAAAGFAAACRSAPATPAPAVSADTWAVVDGRSITREEVEKAYKRTRDTSQALSEEEVLTSKLSLLNDLIVQDILLAKAGQLKIDLPEAELDAAYGDTKKSLADEAFQQELTRRSLTPAEVREGLRRELLAQKVIEREAVSKAVVTDQEIAAFFEANRAQFNMPEESYHIAQIVVTPAREPQVTNGTGDDATTPQAAAAKIQMLMERLKGGASFGDLAMGYSEDPESAPRGGDLGFVPVSRLKQAPPALRDVVLNKSPGTVNVATIGGIHTIVLVLAHEAAGQRDLSMPAVRERITGTLRGRKAQLLRAAYLTSVRGDARVVNYLARKVVESDGKLQ
jgi:peptidyl-prolyl cis-trans isomerase SurA